MTTDTKLISNAFMAFNDEAPKHAESWRNLVNSLAEASALDPKTHSLAYISVLAALNRVNGIPFHVKMAKNHGATRDEIISAILVGLPPAGHLVTEALPAAIKEFDKA